MNNTILVVDDDSDFVELVQALLRDRYVVEGCTDSTSALQRIHQVGPALVFLDLHMPPPSGWDLLLALRADPAFANFPILVVSAAGAELGVDIETLRSRAAGPIEILAKPFEIDDLLSKVAYLIQQRPIGYLSGGQS